MIHASLTTLVALSALSGNPAPTEGAFTLGLPATSGLLSPELFTHSHGFQYSIISGGGQTVQQSMVLNSFDLKLHDALDLRIHLDLAHSASLAGPAMPGAAPSVLPGLELSYRPTENLFFHVDLGRARGSSPYAPYWSSTSFFDAP